MKLSVRFACIAIVTAAATRSPCWAEATGETPAGSAHFSIQFFNALYGHPVDETQTVRERIKSAIATGTSQTTGTVTVELLPESSHGRMDIRLQGTVNIDDAVASQQAARVCSRTSTQVDVRKSVIFAEDGLRHEQAVARCVTNICIRDVQANGPLAERIAARRSHRGVHETECIVAGRTKRRFEARLNDRIGTAVEELDKQLGEQLPFDQVPPVFVSTKDYLQGWIKPQSDREISAPPPDELDASLDVHLLLHEQVLESFAERQFSGRRLTDQQVRDNLEAWCGSAPQSGNSELGSSPWSISMADARPVRVRLTGDNIELELQLADFQDGSDTLPGPITVALELRPELTSDGARLLRLGAPVVRLVESSDRLAAETHRQLAELLRERIADSLPPEMSLDGPRETTDETWQKLQHLAMTRLRVSEEWLEIGYQFADEPAQQPTLDTPAEQPTLSGR